MIGMLVGIIVILAFAYIEQAVLINYIRIELLELKKLVQEYRRNNHVDGS